MSGAAGRLAAWLAAEVADERSAAARPSDPAANYSGHWWSAPCLSGLISTTRALPGHGPLQLTAKEDWPGWSDVRCRPLSPRRPPRAWEITGADDWVALVAPLPAGGQQVPAARLVAGHRAVDIVDLRGSRNASLA